MPLGIRPRPKPNPNATRIKLPINSDNNDSNSEKKMGNIGDVSTLIWLYCDLQPYGKIIVRRGWREGLPKDKPPIWIFCPLIKEQFPRDRILAENCKTCPHYKGVSRDLSTINQISTTTPFHINMISAKKRQPKISFTENQLKEEIKEHKEDEKLWKKEERKIFGRKKSETKS